MTELFRFILKRPAEQASDIIELHPELIRDGRIRDVRGQFRTHIHTEAARSSSADLTYVSKIAELSALLPGHLPAASAVDAKITRVFGSENLSELVAGNDWVSDIRALDIALLQLYIGGKDLTGRGPELTRTRQLYDVVKQASVEIKDDSPRKYTIKPMVLPSGAATEDGTSVDSLRDATAATGNDTTAGTLEEVLQVLNSPAVFEFINIPADPTKVTTTPSFLLNNGWTTLLSSDAKAFVNQTFPGTNPVNWVSVYSTTLTALKTSVSKTQPPPQAGIFSLGGASTPFTAPWALPDAQADTSQSADGWLPTAKPSLVRPAGYGDLFLVKEHLLRYEGGEIGNIQNVLKSEKMLRETNRLDRTEQTNITTNEINTETEKDSQSTERFSLAQEASNVQKTDSAFKAGLSISASYGPTVEVKADTSVADNSSKEASNKVASTYSKEITTKAASKVVEKTFKSTKVTTISQFTEHFKHEFDNTADTATNIAGIYQWVNKITQSQMYNYGERLLIDVIVPEPGAFLTMASSGSAPSLQAPIPFTESAGDINEANYLQIGARYRTPGLKPPPDLTYSTSISFTAQVNEKPQVGAWSTNIKIPAGYLAYAAGLTVSFQPAGQAAGHSLFLGTASLVIGDVFSGPNILGVYPVFAPPFLSDSLGVATTATEVAAFGGAVRVNCVRDPASYAQWQSDTHDAIILAYTAQQATYDRAIAEAAASNFAAVSGQNPAENQAMIRDELKKSCIAIMSSQSFDLFDGLELDTTNNIVQVAYQKSQAQGSYVQFLEQAFEWENLQFLLYPYYWARKATWKDRVSFTSLDPDFADFIKAGACRVSFAARFNFTPDVLYFLQTGKPWGGGPTPTLYSKDYVDIATEIAAAEKKPGIEKPVGDPWEVSVPTELVRLRQDGTLPVWKLDKKSGTWMEDVKLSGT